MTTKLQIICAFLSNPNFTIETDLSLLNIIAQKHNLTPSNPEHVARAQSLYQAYVLNMMANDIIEADIKDYKFE